MSGYELSLLKIPVADVDRAALFYRDVMGFAEEFVVAEYGWGQFAASELPIAVYVPGMGGGQRPVGGTLDFHLSVTAEEFQALAGRVGVEPEESADGLVFFEATDPDGNILKVIQRA